MFTGCGFLSCLTVRFSANCVSHRFARECVTDKFSCWDALPSCFHHKKQAYPRALTWEGLTKAKFQSHTLPLLSASRREHRRVQIGRGWRTSIADATKVNHIHLFDFTNCWKVHSFWFYQKKFQNILSKNHWQQVKKAAPLQIMQQDKTTSRLRGDLAT